MGGFSVLLFFLFFLWPLLPLFFTRFVPGFGFGDLCLPLYCRQCAHQAIRKAEAATPTCVRREEHSLSLIIFYNMLLYVE